MTSETAKRRRIAFYAEENHEHDRNRRTFNPEEPNHRVYARCIRAALDVAQRGLSPEDFGHLLRWLADEYAPPPRKSGEKKVTP